MDKPLDILVISEDEHLLKSDEYFWSRFAVFASSYGRVSVAVLYEGDGPDEAVHELSPALWRFAVKKKRFPWSTLGEVSDLIESQIFFQFQIAADIISAENPFYAGWIAVEIGRRFGRRVEVQVQVNFHSEAFKERVAWPGVKRLVAKRVLRRVHAIRTYGQEIAEDLQRISGVPGENIFVMPPPIDFSYWQAGKPRFDLRQKYPQFNFFLLVRYYPQNKRSFFESLVILSRMLAINPRTGLIVIGESRLSKIIEDYIERNHLLSNVVIESPDELLSLLKTGHVFLNTLPTSEDIYNEKDDLLMKASVASLPVISYPGEMPARIIQIGSTGYICSEGDTDCFVAHIQNMVNDNALRYKLVNSPRNHLRQIIPTSPAEYVDAVYNFHHDIVTR